MGKALIIEDLKVEGFVEVSDYYVGIDPGKQGAIAFYNPTEESLVIFDWPSTDSEDDIIKLIDTIMNENNIVHLCILEKVGAMPKQGVVSMFSFGTNYGIWKAICAFHCWKRMILTPQTWRKGLITPSDGKDPKTACYNVACRLFPKQTDLFKGKRGAIKDGRVDATLMAYKAWQLDTKSESKKGIAK